MKHKIGLGITILLGGLMLNEVQAQSNNKKVVSLNQLFKMADENNRLLKIYAYKEDVAKERVANEKLKRLPDISALATLSYNGDALVSDRDFSNIQRFDVPKLGNGFSLEAKQLIYAGGAVKKSIENVELAEAIAQLDYKSQQQDIRFLITGYYLDLIKLENQQKIVEKNIDQTNKLINQIKAKVTEGVVLKNNITRYELQLKSLQVSLIQIKNTKKIVNNEIVKTLQLPAETELIVDKELDCELQIIDNIDVWKNLAEINNSAIKQADFKIKQAENNEALVRSARLPQVFAMGANVMNGPITFELPVIDNNYNYWYVGVGIKYDISNLYKNKEKENITKLVSSIEKESKNIALDEVNYALEASYIRYLETLEIYTTHLKSIELANQNYTVVKNRYLNDLVLITEMLDAENALLDAEIKAENAKVNILYHYYLLKKISGTI